MATSKAREDIKNDLKTLKEDLKAGAREETQRLKVALVRSDNTQLQYIVPLPAIG